MNHVRQKLMGAFIVAMALPGSPGCFHEDVDEMVAPTRVGVSADTVFWRAFMDPTTFDAWLGTQTVDGTASGCLRRRAAAQFAASEAKLRECTQMVAYTPEWNRCHQDSENLHNGGVIANDIAQAVDGVRSFSGSGGGQTLALMRSVIGVNDWNAFVEALRQSFPAIGC